MAVASKITCAGTTYDLGVIPAAIATTDTSNTYYVLAKTTPTNASVAVNYHSAVYIKNSVLMGAAWNDYAEFRKGVLDEIAPAPGRVVKENGDGTVSIATERLEKGCLIVSDTYGFSIGKTDDSKIPTAVAGRVLAYPDADPSTFTIGAPVCSGQDGTVSMMTEDEEAKYPSRIIGTVSEIPTYETWHGNMDIPVNGRIWIKVK